jgi:hypothetical protein
MARDNLLKEAIADAKAVKEAAIANAMLTLKESFKPQLTSMLAAKLRNESEDSMEEQKKLDSSDIAGGLTVDEPAPKKPSAVASSSSDIENPGQEIETFGEGIEDMMGDEGGEQFGDAGAGDEFGAQGGDGEDDLDLEAIIRELEADLMGGGEDEFGGDMGAPDMDGGMEEPEMEAAPSFGRNVRPENAFVKGTESATDVAHAMKEGEAGGIDKDGKDMKDEKGVDSWKKVAEGDEEVDLEEILREMDAEDDTVDESEHIASENVELKRDLREHREVIKLLRNRINEVTLLNSKLMYTTKIFRSFNLSEGQKKKVVEQFDRAGTLRETKLVYSTLAESLTGKVGTATPRKVAANITEGASKPVGSTKPKSQSVLTEGDTQVARMQKLAGIIAR